MKHIGKISRYTLIKTYVHMYLIHYILYTLLLIHSQTSTVQPLKFGDGWVILSHTLLDMWLHIHAEIEVNQCYLVTGTYCRHIYHSNNEQRLEMNNHVSVVLILKLISTKVLFSHGICCYDGKHWTYLMPTPVLTAKISVFVAHVHVSDVCFSCWRICL